MDLQKIISDLVARLTGNNDLIAKFTADPLGLIKSLLGIDLDAGQLAEVVKGVQSALGTSGGAEGILGKITSFFKKK